MRGRYRTTLAEHLAGSIPQIWLNDLPPHVEVIGDIAVIQYPDHLTRYRENIGRAIISRDPRVRIVLRKVTRRDGKFRIAGYEPVIGNRTETIHRESGFVYQVDLATSFFTSRLAGERQRIASQITPGEVILVPFAGTGPFVIPVAARGAQVIAEEINPDACNMLRKNLEMNRCNDQVHIIRGDAHYLDSTLDCLADRAIIPTPYGFDGTVTSVAGLVRPGGHIHYYTFLNQQEAAALSGRLQEQGFLTSRYHRCGNVAPSVSRWVYDLKKV